MSVFNPDWVRWGNASLFQHFIDALTPIPCFLEGMDRQTDGQDQWIEVRLDGPTSTQMSDREWHLIYNVDLALVAVPNPRDMQQFDRLVGKVVKAFTKTIPVFRYGDQAQDNQTLVECLKIVQPVDIIRAGIAETRVPVVQATVDTQYEMFVEA